MPYVFSTMDDRSEPFNQPIGNWDVSNVTDMSGMFHMHLLSTNLLELGMLSNVTNMSGMFNVQHLSTKT